MNRALRYLTTGLAALAFGFSNPASAQNRVEDVTVLPFKGKGYLVQQEEVSKLWDLISKRINDNLARDFRLVDRSLLESDLKAFGLTLEDFVANPEVAKGKIRGIDGVLTGNYEVWGSVVAIDSKFIYLVDPYGKIETQREVEGSIDNLTSNIAALLTEFREDIGFSKSKVEVSKVDEAKVRSDVGPYVEPSSKKSEFSITPMFSYAMPSSPEIFSDYWSNSIGGGLQISGDPNAKFKFIPRISYRSFGFEIDKFLNDLGVPSFPGTIEGGSINILNIGGEFDINLARNPLTPTRRSSNLDLILSSGYYRVGAGDITVRGGGYYQNIEIGGENAFGMGIGLKFDPSLSKSLSLPVRVEYERIFTEDDHTAVLGVDVGLSIYGGK